MMCHNYLYINNWVSFAPAAILGRESGF